MKRKLLSLFTCCSLLVSLSFFSCGGGSGPGQPGSSGSEGTGVIVDVTAVPYYDGENTDNVDVIQDVCSAGPPPVLEYFADHSANVTFTATNINPSATAIQTGTLYVDYFTINYEASADSIGAPPIESDTVYETIVITPPVPGGSPTSVTVTLVFLDLIRKAQYLSDVQSGQYTYHTVDYLNNYTATYTFYGHNQFGTSFSWQTQTPFQIGEFDYCSSGG